ncbi:MAG: hypothetical protein ACKOAD_01785 [Gammaproteobacteria bacterium]
MIINKPMLTDLIKENLKKHLELASHEELEAGWRLLDLLEKKLTLLEKRVELLEPASGH